MIRPICVISAPVDTRSGYGDMARDICRHIIEMDKYEVVIVSTPWGSTPPGALSPDRPQDKKLLDCISVGPPTLPRQPELYISITVPSEFQAVAKYNIGITAGIETTLISQQWIEGCNRMDVVFTISEHSKRIIQSTMMEFHDNMGNLIRTLKVEKPVEVLHNCVDLDVFKKLKKSEIDEGIDTVLLNVPEKFNFLFVGHWLAGGLGEDRKNVGMLVKLFCETFKKVSSTKRPGLILKTSSADFSILDREDILRKIEAIRATSGPNPPNVYLLHGNLTYEEMNSLYNHPKVKVHISFSKGEGFSRPLLESSMSEKPILASGWSGQLDFLDREHAYLLKGELKPIDAGAVWDGVLVKESSWFNVDPQFAMNAMMHVFKEYDTFLPKAKKLAKINREKFNYQKIFERTKELMEKYVPDTIVPQLAKLKLPTLKKIGEAVPGKDSASEPKNTEPLPVKKTINLPKLQTASEMKE